MDKSNFQHRRFQHKNDNNLDKHSRRINPNFAVNDNKFQHKNNYPQRVNSNFVANNENVNINEKRDFHIGDEIALNLKTELLNYLYLNLDLYQLRYSILRTTEHAQQLKNQVYNITPHFQGYNYFLVFKKLSDGIMGIYIVYRIDLKFDRKDINDKYIKIFKLETNETNSTNLDQYDNTIIDGKLVFKKDETLYLISDILYHKNLKFLPKKIDEKFKLIDDDIKYFNNLLHKYFSVKLIKLYKYNEMDDLVYSKIPKSDFKINGIVFIPTRSSRIFIYLNDSEFDKIKNSPTTETNNIPNIKLPNKCNLANKKLLLQKTMIVDVYEVFTLDKSARLGISCIPNLKMSNYLEDYFKINNQLIIECEFDNKFSKWKPIISMLTDD